MAKGINKVILLGNLGQDPETRAFPDGGSVTNISIATSESWKDKQTGQQQERTEWHKVVFKNRLAEIAAQYLRKGSKVYVEGSLRTRKWTNQQGQEQYQETQIMHNPHHNHRNSKRHHMRRVALMTLTTTYHFKE